MDPTDLRRPSCIDDIAGPAEPAPAHGGYGTPSRYRPYAWEMPWIETPQPVMPPVDEPRPEPPALPRYEDCLLTPDVFARAMRNLDR